ncbi:hypothetical protein [Paenibacillus xylaniclasticus]|uniref:hypothetical protein n=1 Tax=Paenibacillus xylaniclasticus TaxID=588083 RepID=UPI000FDB8B70|nr:MULTISPECIES: hypothetical protein [Paenibacillus]GFN30222.1 hypothetical protein PCURB6_04820 [Paenibacillus curdlanolyticus]
MNTQTTIIFIIAAFVLGGLMIMYRSSIPDRLRRPLAITAIVFILFAFFLIVYSLTTMGS